MFAEFDEKDYPCVKVKLNQKPRSDDDFNHFIQKWRDLYKQKRDYYFLFDTLQVTNPPLKYCIQMSQFIKELRKENYQYLQESIILINNNKVKWLLDFIFTIQPPVAPVYIYHIQNGETLDIESIKKHKNTSIITPSKPLLPIF